MHRDLKAVLVQGALSVSCPFAKRKVGRRELAVLRVL